MSENVSTGSRAEFLARIQRFIDEMLSSLINESKGKDADEKEARALRNSLLKSFRIWERTMLEGHHDSPLEEKLKRPEKQASQGKTKEGQFDKKNVN